MADEVKKHPWRWLTFLGAGLASPAIVLLAYIGGNEYLFPQWGRYAAISLALACSLGMRFITGRSGHEFTAVLLALGVYNLHMSLGGYAYLGWWAIPAFLVFPAACWLLFRRRSRIWRSMFGFSLAILAGLVMVTVFRTDESTRFADHCPAEQAELPDYIKEVAGGPFHPYDFGGTPGAATIGVGYGLDENFYYLLQDENRLVWAGSFSTGIQRVAADPEGSRWALPAWGHWGRDERVYLTDAQGKPLEEIVVPGCRNCFEAEFSGDYLFVLCEVSHSLHRFNLADASQPVSSLVLPGMNAYDLAIDAPGRFAYITDWLSPWLTVVDLKSLEVVSRKWVGFSSFGIAFGPDGLLYVAQMFLRRVQVIQPSDLSLVRTIPADYGPRDLAFDSSRKLLFIGNYFDGTLDVATLDDGERKGRMYVGKLLRGLYFDSPHDRLYLACGCGVRFVEVKMLLECIGLDATLTSHCGE